MLFGDHLVVVRGGGDLATGVVLRLHRAGFPVVVLELAEPLAIRRTVAVASAVLDGTVTVEGLEAVRVGNAEEAVALAGSGGVAVLVSPDLPEWPEPPSVVVDARMAKRNLGTTIEDAPLVVALGPGFVAGEDCHAIVETMRGHALGRVIWEGSALPNTGRPGMIGGQTSERVVRAERAGVAEWGVAIADVVSAEDTLGTIDGAPVRTSIGGVVRGLLPDGYRVEEGLKIADIDPRANPSACFEVSDKSLSIGGGVVEAVLAWLNRA